MSSHDGVTLHPIGAAILRIAQQEAVRLYHDYIGTEHVLIALTRAAGGYTERMLQRLSWQPAYLRAEVRACAGVGRARSFLGFRGALTLRLQRALDAAQETAGASGLGERELLLAVLRGGPGVAVRVLISHGQAIEDLIAGVETDPGPEATGVLLRAARVLREEREQSEEGAQAPVGHGSTTPILDRYGRDLTAAAKAGKLREAIGRRQIRDQIVQVLVQQDRNVPVLVGEAGVGKTAIVEGLAARLAQEDERPVIPLVRGKRIIELRMADLVAGAGVRGEFEERVQGLLRECATHLDIILFIDEIHTLIGAGHSSGNQDAAQLLKPALANGELRVIGATTPAEYQRYIAKDAALERRMQPIRVDELTLEQTEDLLRELRPQLEEAYTVQIRPEALSVAVELSVRYLPERRLPDKAISLLHEACAFVLVGGGTRLGTESHGLVSILPDATDDDAGPIPVTPQIVAEIAARRLGVPVGEITASDRDRLLTLEHVLATRIKAQDEAIQSVVQVLRVGWSDLRDPGRPRAILLFFGPTGVGKTETARVLADVLYVGQRDQHLLILDMAEFSQEHMVAQLIGAPPGYVGYEQEGRLSGWLRQHPYGVVLFDEIEKAHPAARRILLSLFEEGRLTDAQGRTVNGREAIYILTTNWTPLQAGVAPGPECVPPAGSASTPSLTEPELRQRLGPALSPELVNRIDRVVPFRPLDHTALTGVAQLQLDKLQQRVEASGVTLWIDAAVLDWLVDHGADPVSNARGLARLIDRAIAEPIAALQARGKLTPGTQLNITVAGNQLKVAT